MALAAPLVFKTNLHRRFGKFLLSFALRVRLVLLASRLPANVLLSAPSSPKSDRPKLLT